MATCGGLGQGVVRAAVVRIIPHRTSRLTGEAVVRDLHATHRKPATLGRVRCPTWLLRIETWTHLRHCLKSLKTYVLLSLPPLRPWSAHSPSPRLHAGRAGQDSSQSHLQLGDHGRLGVDPQVQTPQLLIQLQPQVWNRGENTSAWHGRCHVLPTPTTKPAHTCTSRQRTPIRKQIIKQAEEPPI